MNYSLNYFSGYIRNKENLMKELGIKPKDDVDGFIILKGYEMWREKLPEKIMGTFAFAIQNNDTGDLFLCRDHFGIEQLFYYQKKDGKLLFSGDIKSIASDSGYHKEIDYEALKIYFSLGYPAGDKTLFKGIKKIPAGSFLSYNESNGTEIKISSYYNLKFNPDYSKSEDYWEEEIDKCVTSVIMDDLYNPEKTCSHSFLSCGVDSSFLLSKSNAKCAHGIGYDETEDESLLANETAKYLDRDFDKVVITGDDYFHAVKDAVRSIGLPLADMSNPALFLGCKNMSKLDNYCFSGEGSDEFWGGYNIYKRAESLAHDDGPLHFGCSGIMDEASVDRLIKDSCPDFELGSLVKDIYDDTKNMEHLCRLLSIDIQLFLEGDIFIGLNCAAKANGITILTPLADPRVFELSARIPSELKVKGDIGKYILRKAASRYLPEEVAFRKKIGFAVPVSKWIRQGKFYEDVIEKLKGESCKELFNQDFISRIVNNFEKNEYGPGFINIVYTIYVFILWYEEVFKKIGYEF